MYVVPLLLHYIDTYTIYTHIVIRFLIRFFIRYTRKVGWPIVLDLLLLMILFTDSILWDLVKLGRDQKHGGKKPPISVAFWKGYPRLFQGNLGRGSGYLATGSM